MTRPKGSAAVMARRVSPPDALDYFPTPPWAVRGFCEWLTGIGWELDGLTCWEPACGEGHMAMALAEWFGHVHPSDIFPYGFGEVRDFLPQPLFDDPRFERAFDWVITNPPFTKAGEFASAALGRARHGVALLLRTAWLEGEERWRELFSGPRRPTVWLQSVERIAMFEGRLDPGGSSATAYGWAVWFLTPDGEVARGRELAASGARLEWLPPCRDRLERPEDYPQAPIFEVAS